MKRTLSLALALILCLGLCACGGTAPEADTAASTTAPVQLTAKEQLTEKELALFDALVKMVTSDFYEPSAIRVLEVGDLDERTKWADDADLKDMLYGPDSVVVRLQGENRVGGTLNNYYRVCITAAENMSESAQSSIKNNTYLGFMDAVLRHKGEVGDYVELENYEGIEEDASDMFDIGRINKALKEYWEDMGF